MEDYALEYLFARQENRRAFEKSRAGGAPRKTTESVLQLTKQILDANSKQGTQVAKVHRHAEGRGQPKSRGSQEAEITVPSMSLLKKPARMWEENPALRRKMGRSQFYKILKSHFAEYRPGQRRTDVCTHCQTYYDHLIPNFHKDWNDLQAKLKAVYPEYMAHWRCENHDRASSEASAALAYLNHHAEQYRQERATSGCDLLQLHTFTEAPGAILLRGHKSLLKSYKWHMTSAHRQKDNFEKWTEGGLPLADSLICFDWKEKLRLPCGPSESSDFWHMQQKYAIAVYGSVVHRHAPGSSAARPKIFHEYFINLTEIREQTAEAANHMLASVMQDAAVAQSGTLRLFSDCGPHFRSGANLAHYADLCVQRRQQIHISYWGEQHGKSILDGAFGTLGAWLREMSLQQPVLNLSELLAAFRKASAAAMRADPAGPKWHFKIVDCGKHKQRVAKHLQTSDFQITKTYSLIMSPPAPGRNLPILHNTIFTDCEVSGLSCSFTIHNETAVEPQEWLRAYMSGPRSWEIPPPAPGDSTVIVARTQASTKTYSTD